MKLCSSILLAVAVAANCRAAASPFGICEHIAAPSNYMQGGEYTNRVAMLNYCRAAGIGMVRTDFRWRLCRSAASGDWSWTYFDNVLADAERRGVEVLPILFGDNPATGAKAYDDLDGWAEFVRQVVTRYKGRISAVEVWNEWNHPYFWTGTIAQYARLLERTAATVRAVDPSVRIVMGGVAGADLASIEKLCKEAALDAFDAAAFHPYCYPNPPDYDSNWLARRIETLRTLLDGQGRSSATIWVTEIGWPTEGDAAVTEALQAVYITNAVNIAVSAGAEKVFTYELRAWGVPEDGREGSFGIVNRDNSARPGLYAYRAYIRSQTTGEADPLADAVFFAGSDGWDVRSFSGGAGWSDRRAPHPDADYIVDFGDAGTLWTPSASTTFGGRSLTLGRVNGLAGNVRQIGWNVTATVSDLRLGRGRWEVTSGAGNHLEVLAGAATVLSPASDPFVFAPAAQGADHAFTLSASLSGAASSAIAFTEGATETDTLDATVSGDASAFAGRFMARGPRVTLRLDSAALAGCEAAPRSDGVALSDGATLAPLFDGQSLSSSSRGFSSDGTAVIEVPDGWSFTLSVPLSGSFLKRGEGTLVIGSGVSGAGGIVVEEGSVVPENANAASRILSIPGGRVLGTLGADSFEGVAVGTATAALDGWTGEGSVASATPVPGSGVGWPLPGENHSKALKLEGAPATRDYAESGVQERASLDMLVQVRRFGGDWSTVFTPAEGEARMSVAFDSDGAPWLWHADAEGRPVWTRLRARRAFVNGDWVRVSLDFDYATNPQGLAFVQVRLDGWCATAPEGWKKPFESVGGGTWFRLLPVDSGAKSVSRVGFEGALALDDVVLASRDDAEPSPFGREKVFVPGCAMFVK